MSSSVSSSNEEYTSSDKYDAIRVVYRPVTDDLPGNRKILHDEESVDLVEFKPEHHNGNIVRILGRTADGKEVISPTPESNGCSVRARNASGESYSQHLGWVQRLEAIENAD